MGRIIGIHCGGGDHLRGQRHTGCNVQWGDSEDGIPVFFHSSPGKQLMFRKLFLAAAVTAAMSMLPQSEAEAGGCGYYGYSPAPVYSYRPVYSSYRPHYVQPRSYRSGYGYGYPSYYRSARPSVNIGIGVGSPYRSFYGSPFGVGGYGFGPRGFGGFGPGIRIGF